MFKRILAAALAPALSLFILLSPMAAQAQANFCWKSSYGRGVGTIPPACNTDRVKQDGMCYNACKSGWEGAATMCLRTCPSGYVNTGLTCHIDKALLIGAKFDVCNFSTSCPSGYTNAGLLCGLNTPGVPAGYEAAIKGPAASGLDLSRQIYDRGIGLAPSVCDGGKVNSGGLCYSSCKPNFSGVGPVCWGTCPKGWTDCGAGCAPSASGCGKVILSQVAAVGMSVVKIGGLIVTAGGSAGATNDPAQAELARTALQQLKDTYEANKLLIQASQQAGAAGAAYTNLLQAVTPEQIVKATMELINAFEPTGLSGAAASFTYSTCDKINP
jgi:hypothetical protein